MTSTRKSFTDSKEAAKRGKRPNGEEAPQPKIYNPEEPPPEAWETPLPLGGLSECKAPEFPLAALPTPLADAVFELAAAMQCPIDYPACATLAVAAGLIGATHKLEIKDGYVHSPSLILAVVGASAAKKSPPLRKILQPVSREHARRAKKGLLVRVADQGAKFSPLKIYEPGHGELIITNATAEGLKEILYCQPRGLTLFSDEILSWLNSQNAYRGGKGADRQDALTIADGGGFSIVRKGTKENLYADRPALTIFGGIQPSVLPDLFTRGDGLTERISWCWPEPLPEGYEDGKKWERHHWDMWAGACEKLWSLEMTHGDREYGEDPGPPTKTRTIKLDESGWEQWCEFRRVQTDETNSPTLPQQLKGHFVKNKDLCAKLSIVSEFLNWSIVGRGSQPNCVTGISMARAAMLAEYFRGHVRRVLGHVAGDNRTESVRDVWKWISETRKCEPFSRADAWASMSRRLKNIEQLNSPLSLLCKLRWIREIEQPYSGIGRKPLPIYEVNPELKSGKPAPMKEME